MSLRRKNSLRELRGFFRSFSLAAVSFSLFFPLLAVSMEVSVPEVKEGELKEGEKMFGKRKHESVYQHVDMLDNFPIITVFFGLRTRWASREVITVKGNRQAINLYFRPPHRFTFTFPFYSHSLVPGDLFQTHMF